MTVDPVTVAVLSVRLDTPPNLPARTGHDTPRTVRITLTNDHDTPFTCTHLILGPATPSQDNDARRTTNRDSGGQDPGPPDEPVRLQAPTGPPWTAHRDPDGALRATPDQPAVIPPDTTLILLLDTPAVPAPPDTPRVRIAVQGHRPDTPPYQQVTTHPLPVNGTIGITNFAPTAGSFDRGESVDLEWQITGTSEPQITLTAGTTTLNPTEYTVDHTGNDYTCTITGGFFKNTPILLKVSDPYAAQLHYADALTLVTIKLGDVDAGDLTVTGTVTMFTTPRLLAILNSQNTTYRTTDPFGTDGFIDATVSTDKATTPATLTVSLAPPPPPSERAYEPNTALTLHSGGDRQTEHMLIPVKRGTQLVAELDKGVTPTATMTWFPLGTEPSPPTRRPPDRP